MQENTIFTNKDGITEINGTSEFKLRAVSILEKEKKKAFQEGKESVMYNIIKSIEKLAEDK